MTKNKIMFSIRIPAELHYRIKRLSLEKATFATVWVLKLLDEHLKKEGF